MKASTAWRLLIVTVFICQMGWREGAAATHYVVPTNLSAANPYTNWGTAGTNIIDVVNAAMTNATTPRVVWVTNGTYALTNQVSITNAITVQGFTNNGAVVIDGQNNTRCFNLSHTNAILDGFVITRGFTNSGGGVHLSAGTVQNCAIVSNESNGSGLYAGGGGVAFYAANLTNAIIQNCIISYNRANEGGGIWIYYLSSGTVRDCQIYNNTATSTAANTGGGGICVGKDGLFQRCTICGNVSANNGGGMGRWTGGNLEEGCVVVSNSALNNGGGIWLQGSTITNCTVRYNTAKIAGGIAASYSTVANCTIEGNTGTNGNANNCGGGIGVSHGLLINSLIKGNHANYSGGGVQAYGDATVRNCLIINNTAGQRGAGVNIQVSKNVFVQNCTIASNATTSAM